MNKAHIKLLQEKYNAACEEYLKAFCTNYELCYESDAWVGQDVGTVASVGDQFFDFTVIRYCVDNELTDYNELLQWYDYTTECISVGLSPINFMAWHKKCPHISSEKLSELSRMKADLEKEIEALSGQPKRVHIF